MVHIVSLRSKDQVLCELRISKDHADTKQDIPKMELEPFISNENFFTLEWWAARQIVNNSIETIYSMV